MKITLERISKNYGSKVVLKDINLTLKPGITGLLGRNGAGKSTLMRLLATIDKPTTGKLYYQNKNLMKEPIELRRQLGYLPQNFGVYPNMNPVEFLEYMAAMKGLPRKEAKKRISELLEILHLSHVRRQLLGGFSGGMRQRVGIAQALLNEPNVLILDEPTVGLDPDERIQFRNFLASISYNRIILFSTHIVTDIESIAPYIAIMEEGKIIENTKPEHIIAKVSGKVYEMVVTMERFLELKSKYIVSNSIQQEDGIHVRIISDKKPSFDAVLQTASLEDAYLYHTQSVGGHL